MISSDEIAVIIQGAVIPNLLTRTIVSVRELLPDAELVLSTWNNTDISNFDCDKFVLSQDPGFININLLGNINRQIVGRQNALKNIHKPYSLIIRSDCEIINLNFIKEFDGRIVSHSAGPIRSKWLYHLNDWNFFGKTEDLCDLYDIPLFSVTPNEDYTHIKYQTPHNWLAWNYFSKFIDVTYSQFRKATKKQIKEYKKLLLQKFNLIGFHDDFGIINLKEPYFSEMLKYRSNLKARIKQYQYNFMRPNKISLSKILSLFTRNVK